MSITDLGLEIRALIDKNPEVSQGITAKVLNSARELSGIVPDIQEVWTEEQLALYGRLFLKPVLDLANDALESDFDPSYIADGSANITSSEASLRAIGIRHEQLKKDVGNIVALLGLDEEQNEALQVELGKMKQPAAPPRFARPAPGAAPELKP